LSAKSKHKVVQEVFIDNNKYIKDSKQITLLD